MKLQGKVALVTGAAKRVGRTIAMALAQRGAKIAIHYHRSRKDALRLKDEIESSYGRDADIFQADLANPRDLKKLADAVLRRFDAIHVLVNSASTYDKAMLGKTDAPEWNETMNVNLRAPFLLSQSLGLVMKKAGEGKIINLSDWAGKRPYVEYIPYCVSKAGLLCLTTAMAKALAPEVQVNAVLPGPVLLPENFTSKQREAVKNATLVQRLGSPDDVARAVLFLIEDSDFITGAELTVDGGRLIA